MKMAISIIFFGGCCTLCAQGTFQNLNFESANVGSIVPMVPVSSALPGWTASLGSTQLTTVGYNALSTGATAVSLIGPPSPVAALDGNYSVLLTGGVTASDAAISQTGTIPVGTKSLLFEASEIANDPTEVLNVQVGTQTVAITPVGTAANYALYAVNISAWAGDTEQLSFSAPNIGGLNHWEIDDITFSPNAVPEPRPFVLSGIAGLLFAAYRRFSPKQQ